MPRYGSRSRYGGDSDSDSEYPPAIQIPISMGSSRRHHSRERRRQSDLLAVPLAIGGRQRASSTGAAPQPQVVIDVGGRSSSGSHSRSRSRSRHRASFGSDEGIVVLRDHHRKYSPSPSRHGLDYDTRRKLDKLEEMEKEERDEELRKELRRKIKLEELEAAEKARRKKEKEKEERKRHVEEWKLEEQEKKEKEKKKKDEEDKLFEEKVKAKFMAAGYSEAHVESIIREKKYKKDSNTLALDISRPTWIKVHRKYLHPETLKHYGLPWDFYDKNTDYIIIKRYISNDLQNELFEHTRTLKTKKLIVDDDVVRRDVTTTLRVGPDKDKMYLVRSKSQSRAKSKDRRRSWIFT